MIVRDLSLKKTDYKGHPTHAIEKECPCRPCFNAHDCRPPDPRFSKKVYSDIFSCATNWNNGCPPRPFPEPKHDLNRVKHCRRCGQYVR